MGLIAAIILGSVVLLGGLIALVLLLVFHTADALAGSPHNDGAEIVDTRLAPVHWGGRRGKAAVDTLPGMRKRRALRRLSRAIRYFRHTPLVDDDTDRARIVTRLQQVRREWRAKAWQEIYPWRR